MVINQIIVFYITASEITHAASETQAQTHTIIIIGILGFCLFIVCFSYKWSGRVSSL